MDLINLLKFIRKISVPSDASVESKHIKFGEVTRHKTLIFDLDETLIHSQFVSADL